MRYTKNNTTTKKQTKTTNNYNDCDSVLTTT